MLSLSHVDQETLPNRCYEIKGNINVVEAATWITGHHDEKSDEYHELLTQKSKLMDCDNKNGASNKYLRRDEIYEDSQNKLFLHNAHCPELNKFLAKHSPKKANFQEELSSTQVKLLLDVKREANELACEHKIPFVEYK